MVDHDVDASTARRFYDRISHAYDLIADNSEHAARETGERLFAPRPSESILEIGYGTGHSLVSFAKAVGAGGKVVGVDVSEGMLAVASRRLEEAGLAGRVRLIVGDARRLPCKAAGFDGVFSSFTLELFEPDDRARVLSEVRRILRPGGRLGVVSLADPDNDVIPVRIYKWLHRHFPHFVDCQPIDVREVLAGDGFAIEASDRLSIWGLPVSVVVARPRDGGNPTNKIG